MQNIKDAEITRTVWQKIDALPQRECILESDARAWVSEVVAKYGDLAIWHASRAGGFGGSQIGALVKNFLGERADHEASAHDIVAGALLRKIPDNSNGHMRRGIAMEPQHRIWFHEKYNSTRDEVGFKALSKSVGQRQWMRYSPDDLAFMNIEGQKRRILIDYKAPSEVEQVESVAFQYSCQLHMGRMVLEHNGFSVDGLMLSQFDWKNWSLKDDMVPYNAELDGLILKAGDHFWDFVMRGEVPPYVRKARLADEEQLRAQIGPAALKMARLKALATTINRHIETFESQIKPVIAQYRLGRDKVVLDGISYTASPVFDSTSVLEKLPVAVYDAIPLKGNATKSYDEKAMLKALKDANIDVKQFAKPASKDGDALFDALVAHGVDAEALVAEQLKGTVDKKLSAEVGNWFDREFQDFLPTAESANVAEAEGADAASDGREAIEVSSYAPRPVPA